MKDHWNKEVFNWCWNDRSVGAETTVSGSEFQICEAATGKARPPIIIMPHQIIWRWYIGRWWVGCYIWYSKEGTGRSRSPPRPLLAIPNVTAHPSTDSVPNTVLLYNGPLLCGFNMPIKGLIPACGYCFGSVTLWFCGSVRPSYKMFRFTSTGKMFKHGTQLNVDSSCAPYKNLSARVMTTL